MTTRRDELLRAAAKSTANYKFASESLANARRALALGMGDGSDLAIKAQIEHTSYHRMLRASEAFAMTEPKTAPKPRATASAAPAIASEAPDTKLSPTPPATRPTLSAPAVAPKASAPKSGSVDLLGFLNDRVERSENDWRHRYGLRPLTK